MKDKFLYKRVRFSEWEVVQHEAWLSDMAMQGWALDKEGFVWAKFKEIEPKQLMYRIDLTNEKVSQVLQEQYGWCMVETSSRYSIYVSEQIDESARLFETEMPLLKVIKSRVLGIKMSMGICFVMVLILIGISISYMNFGRGMVLLPFLENDGFIVPIFLVLTQLISMSTQRQEYRGFKQLKQMIEQQGKINRKVAQADISNKGKNGLKGIVTLSMVVLGIYLMCHMGHKPIEGLAQIAPIVRLATLEEGVKIDEERYNYYEEIWSPLLVKKYEVEEHGIDVKLGSQIQNPNIKVTCYQLVLRAMKKQLVKDLITSYQDRMVYVHKNIQPTEVEGLDEFYTLDKDYNIEVIAVKGHTVMHIQYKGNATLEQLVQAVREVLD